MFKRLILAIVLSFSTAALLHAADPAPAKPAPSGELGKVGAVTPVEVDHTHVKGPDAHGEKAELLPNPTHAETWWQALWVVIIFVVLLAVLYPTAWKNVLAGLKAR